MALMTGSSAPDVLDKADARLTLSQTNTLVDIIDMVYQVRMIGLPIYAAFDILVYTKLNTMYCYGNRALQT